MIARRKMFAGCLSAAALVLAAGAAHADEKSGTLNVAIAEQIEGISPIYAPGGEPQLYDRVVFDKLISFDPKTNAFLPLLAKSWKQIDATTWEFTLRDDVTFHDGSVFDADDAVYTFNWVADPKVRFRLKNRFTWIRGAEKVDAHTVRLSSKRPFARTLGLLSTNPPMFPSDVHGAMADKSRFGQEPIGTGAYRAASVDPDGGIVLEARGGYVQANRMRPAPAITRVRILPIHDAQTRVAQLLIGNVDLTRVVNKDTGSQLAQDPRFAVTSVNGLQYNYLALDAADRSGIGALKDLRVRQAIAHAIDRAELKRDVVVGGETALEMDALCIPFQVGCATKVPLSAYDPAKAKRLLANAGYPDGFEIELTAIARTRGVAEAVSGYLRDVGIRAKIRQVTFVVYRKLQLSGQMQGSVQIYGSGGVADAGTVLNFHFIAPARDYARDAKLTELTRLADGTLDAARRATLMRDAFDLNNRQVYVIPLAAAPQVFVHAKDLVVPAITLNGYGAVLNQLTWK